MTFQEFIDKWNGKAADFDGFYGPQCVDLFNFYNRDVVGAGRLYTPTTGGAADLWNDFSGPGASAYRKIENTPTGVPMRGDVVIWRANQKNVTGPAGHVGIFMAGDVNSFTSFDQNYPTGSLSHPQFHRNYAGVLGWLRPLSNDIVPAAPVEPPVAAPQSTPEVESLSTPTVPEESTVPPANPPQSQDTVPGTPVDASSTLPDPSSHDTVEQTETDPQPASTPTTESADQSVPTENQSSSNLLNISSILQNLAQYKKAIGALVGAALVIWKVAADGTISADDLQVVGVALGTVVAVFGLRNQPQNGN